MGENFAEIISASVGRFLNVDGFLYYKHSGGFRRYWCCRKKGVCFARAITDGDDDNLIIIKGPQQSPHNHAPDREEIEAIRIGGRLKRLAQEHPELPPAQILRRELRSVPSGI